MRSELRAACQKLVEIVRSSPDERSCDPFGPGEAVHHAPDHRCLSQAEAGAKLRGIERLTNRSVAQLLAGGWDRLSPTQTLEIESVLSILEPGERTQPLGDQAPVWHRLDEQLFRLAFTAWIKGTNFVVAPRPSTLADQVGVDATGYRNCLQELRDALVRSTTLSPRWPPRVNLWLGDPAPDEVGPPMPRLWVSVRVLKLTGTDAAEMGLLPAETLIQEHLALEHLCRRWVSRADDASLPSGAPDARRQYTICCRCGQTLAV